MRFLIAALLFLQLSSVSADDLKGTHAYKIVETLAGVCVRNRADYSVIPSIIEGVGGKELDERIINADPVLKNNNGRAFVVPYEGGLNFVVSYSDAGGCSVSAEDIDPDNAAKLVEKVFKSPLVTSDNFGLQITKVFKSDPASRLKGAVFVLIYADNYPANKNGTLSFAPAGAFESKN